jgi:hypothetical protein
LLIPTAMSTSDSSNNTVSEALAPKLPPKLPPRVSSSTSSPRIPAPALPDRAKSVDQLSLDTNTSAATTDVETKKTSSNKPSIEEHYAYLSKHAKEFRRRKAKNHLTAPKLSDFQQKQTAEGNASSTNWIGFIEAVSLTRGMVEFNTNNKSTLSGLNTL